MNTTLNYGKKPNSLWNKLKQKPHKTLEFKMTEASETLFSFDIPLFSEEKGKWISSSKNLRVYKRVFNLTEKINIVFFFREETDHIE